MTFRTPLIFVRQGRCPIQNVNVHEFVRYYKLHTLKKNKWNIHIEPLTKISAITEAQQNLCRQLIHELYAITMVIILCWLWQFPIQTCCEVAIIMQTVPSLTITGKKPIGSVTPCFTASGWCPIFRQKLKFAFCLKIGQRS